MKYQNQYIIENKKLKLNKACIPELKAGEVLVKIKSIGINRADILQVKGAYPNVSSTNNVPGLEFSGEVCDINKVTKDTKVGDRVCGLTGSGAYAEYIAINEGSLITLPESISFAEGAAIPESWATAYFNLFIKGHIKNDERILVHSAGGGVGLAAIQLAKHHGANVIAVAGNDYKITEIKKLNPDFILNYKTHPYSILTEQFENKVDLILDTLGGDMLPFHMRLLGYAGRLLLIGLLRGVKSEIDMKLLIRNNISIIASTMRSQDLATKINICSYLENSVVPKISEGGFKVHLAKVFGFNELEKSHEYILENKNIGNVVVNL